MLGLVIILAISWLLLHLFQKENLSVLGFLPVGKRLSQFVIGLGFAIVLRLVLLYFETEIKSMIWAENPSISIRMILHSFWYHLKSTLTEDLVFRGALLYILIKRVGFQFGLLISGIAFGIYHWFSYGMLNANLVPLIYVFITTGLTGYIWAYTFAITKSIMMPLGFHLGLNFIMTLFYDAQPFGQLLYMKTSHIELSEWNSLYYSLFVGLFPSLVTFLFVRTFRKKIN